MNEDEKQKQRKRAIITVVVFWAVIAVFAIGFFMYTLGRVSVSVKFAPFAATVRLNGTVLMNNHDNYIEPGEYHLVVEYENFETLEEDIRINDMTKYLFDNLEPLNDDGVAYMNAHNEEFLEVQGIAGSVAIEMGDWQREKYPIIEKLPVKDPYYNIGYNLNDEGGVDVTVEAAIAYRQLAVSGVLDVMEDEDFGKYDVVFYDLDSPYTGKFVDNDESDPAEYLMAGFSGAGVDFTVEGGVREGEYYYAYLRSYYRDFINVVYRVVLIADGEGWKLAAEPYPLLTTFNTPGVPLEIINKVNKL